MKKVGTGGVAPRRGPDEDEIFEDEENEWAVSGSASDMAARDRCYDFKNIFAETRV
jgi:hypothetical protein